MHACRYCDYDACEDCYQEHTQRKQLTQEVQKQDLKQFLSPSISMYNTTKRTPVNPPMCVNKHVLVKLRMYCRAIRVIRVIAKPYMQWVIRSPSIILITLIIPITLFFFPFIHVCNNPDNPNSPDNPNNPNDPIYIYIYRFSSHRRFRSKDDAEE